jgi:hypothetical protein
LAGFAAVGVIGLPDIRTSKGPSMDMSTIPPSI